MNAPAVAPTATGFLTVYPSGVGRPVASSLNFVPGQVVPNLVVSGLGADGRLAIYNFTGSTEVVVDIVGWYG
ncbi:MAG: hypothetical protein FGM58_03205 [Acidimicrobiia bacterium]|nr:hypothetical protein [Acidimicrobiia bacterium]